MSSVPLALVTVPYMPSAFTVAFTWKVVSLPESVPVALPFASCLRARVTVPPWLFFAV